VKIALILIWITSYSSLIGYLNAQLDSFLYWYHGRKLTHWTRSIIRIVLMSASSYLPFNWLEFDSYLFVSMLAYSGVTFWLVFEHLFNKWINQDENFIGTTAELDKLEWKVLGIKAQSILPWIKKGIWIVLLATFILAYYKNASE
jgi:hypothetical protein